MRVAAGKILLSIITLALCLGSFSFVYPVLPVQASPQEKELEAKQEPSVRENRLHPDVRITFQIISAEGYPQTGTATMGETGLILLPALNFAESGLVYNLMIDDKEQGKLINLMLRFNPLTGQVSASGSGFDEFANIAFDKKTGLRSVTTDWAGSFNEPAFLEADDLLSCGTLNLSFQSHDLDNVGELRPPTIIKIQLDIDPAALIEGAATAATENISIEGPGGIQIDGQSLINGTANLKQKAAEALQENFGDFANDLSGTLQDEIGGQLIAELGITPQQAQQVLNSADLEQVVLNNLGAGQEVFKAVVLESVTASAEQILGISPEEIKNLAAADIKDTIEDTLTQNFGISGETFSEVSQIFTDTSDAISQAADKIADDIKAQFEAEQKALQDAVTSRITESLGSGLGVSAEELQAVLDGNVEGAIQDAAKAQAEAFQKEFLASASASLAAAGIDSSTLGAAQELINGDYEALIKSGLAAESEAFQKEFLARTSDSLAGLGIDASTLGAAQELLNGDYEQILQDALDAEIEAFQEAFTDEVAQALADSLGVDLALVQDLLDADFEALLEEGLDAAREAAEEALTEAFEQAQQELIDATLGELGSIADELLDSLADIFGSEVAEQFGEVFATFSDALALDIESIFGSFAGSFTGGGGGGEGFTAEGGGGPGPEGVNEFVAATNKDLSTSDTGHLQDTVDKIVENYVTALMMMTEQLSAVMIQQVEGIGLLLDAKHQLESQRILQTLQAKAHKDYHPSDQMCRFGTFIRSVANSESKSEADQRQLNEVLMERYRNVEHTSSSEGLYLDVAARLDQFRTVYCDPKDNNNGLIYMCDHDGFFGDGEVGGQDKDRLNKDIDYTRTVDYPLTLSMDFSAGAKTNDMEDVIALGKYLYWPAVIEPVPDPVVAERYKPYQNFRRIIAVQNVAHNSYASIVGMKSSAQDRIGEDSGWTFMKAFLREFNVIVDGDDAIQRYMGELPSYYAQMEILTKKIYQDPDFYTNLYDKPANIKRNGVSMQAIALIQNRDHFESMLRREMLISLMVEEELLKHTEETNVRLYSGMKKTQNP
ncbi:MAG: hypothetical protein DHS20C02_14960 [Micavibrio sp.]|nr:MAG: hypothetical protein DHS20C02_14960 [Micavibrio sp.]